MSIQECRSIEVINKGVEPSWKVSEVPCLFTIGYEGKTITSFINRLNLYGVLAIIDVRCNAISRKPGFSKKSLKEQLENRGIDYFHFSQLGVPSSLRKNLSNEVSYQKLFRYYDEFILPSKQTYIAEIYKLLNSYRRIALMCFENDFRMCHRSRIANYFDRDKTSISEVIHL